MIIVTAMAVLLIEQLLQNSNSSDARIDANNTNIVILK